LETEESEVETLIQQEEARELTIGSERSEMATIRGVRP
jgi:hypothetical protein